MDIKEIKNPKFLKKLNNKELEYLSNDIRKFIIDNVSITGGHLSSNLGIVDLTIAMHKVFDCPKDKFIFDVGHQSYTHKILTGRATLFNTLRQYKGISGFQNMKESIYDPYEAGHSSTSLSAALGMAIARDKNRKNYNVIAVIGDGSIGNGLAYEALNHIGDTNTKLIVILNDNEMSISQNIGALHNTLDTIRAANKYSNAKSGTKKILNNIPLIGKPIRKGIDNLKSSFKKLYLKEGFIFEELGLKYYGPINGHDYNEMLLYLDIAKRETRPVLLHVITEKGKGYSYAENDTTGSWHGVSPFNIETGQSLSKSNKLSWSEIISDSLLKLAKKNKDIIAITPAMAGGSKLLKFKSELPNQFIDVGIAEEHALILANSLAISGKKPFVSIYSTFLQRGYDQIVHDIARMNSNVVIGIDRCGIVGEDGISHQGIYDISFLLPIPNTIIMSPKDSIEAKNMLNTAFKINKPVFIRYSREKIDYQKDKKEVISIGSWEKITEGKEAIIISYGDFLQRALNINQMLLKDRIHTTIINARFIKPIDNNMFEELLKHNKPIFVYEESTSIGSLGSYLNQLSQAYNYKNKIYTIGIDDHFVEHGNKEEILKSIHLDENNVYNTIKRLLQK